MKFIWRNRWGEEVCIGIPLWFKRGKGYDIQSDNIVDGYKVYKLVIGISQQKSWSDFAYCIRFRIGIGPSWEYYTVVNTQHNHA